MTVSSPMDESEQTPLLSRENVDFASRGKFRSEFWLLFRTTIPVMAGKFVCPSENKRPEHTPF